MPRTFIPLIPEQPVSMTRVRGQYADYLNGFFDIYEGSLSQTRKVFFNKRPWVVPAVDNESTLSNLTGFTPNTNTVISGVINSLDNTKLIFTIYNQTGAAADAKYFDCTTNTLTDRATPAGWGSTTVFTRLDGISYGSGVFYAATDFTKGAVIDSTGTWTEITDADYTGLGTKTNFVGMDGYLFFGVISGTGAGRIYNTDLNVSTSLVSTSFLSVTDYPGAIVWLARLRNYIIVFKQYSVEFYENVGNPIPGSPLEPQKQLNRKIGLAAAGSVQEVSDGIIFLGIDENGKTQMFKISKYTLEIKEISVPLIEYGVMNQQVAFSFFSMYANYTSGTTFQVASQVLNWKNKELYLITVPSPTETGTDIVTMVYDNELNLWTRWNGAGGVSFFGCFMCLPVSTPAYRGPLFVYNNNVGTGGSNEAGSFQSVVSDLTFSNAETGEVGTTTAFEFSFLTDELDFGDMTKRKFLDALVLHFDANINNPAFNSTISMQYVGSDFVSFSTASTRSITFQTDWAKTRAIWRRLGWFYRRAFRFSESSIYFMRFSGIEAVYNSMED